MNIVGCQNPNCKTGRPATLIVRIPIQTGMAMEQKPITLCAVCGLEQYKALEGEKRQKK